MGIGRILLLIFGVIFLFVGIGLLFGGGAALWANSTFKDDEGYLTTKTLEIEKDSYAVISEPADVDLGSAWVWDWGNLVTFKVEASNDDASKNVFIGLADEQDVDDFLRDVAHDEVTDFDVRPDRLEYRHNPGSSEPGAPTARGFWSESVHGSGTQTLQWELESGSWVLVLMNEDGAAGVDLSVVVGAKIPWLFGAGIGLLVGGVFVLLVAFLMIFFAVRRS
jgi:hypothetical protein